MQPSPRTLRTRISFAGGAVAEDQPPSARRMELVESLPPLPLLSDAEAEAKGGSRGRLPHIDLMLPRLDTPLVGTPRSIHSGLTAKANSLTSEYIQLLNAHAAAIAEEPPKPTPPVGRPPRRRSCFRTPGGVAESDMSESEGISLAVGELAGMLAAERVRTGLWDNSDVPVGPRAAENRPSASTTKKKTTPRPSPAQPRPQPKPTDDYVATTPRVSILERVVAIGAASANNREDVGKEIAEKLELLRGGDPEVVSEFRERCQAVLRDQRRQHIAREGTEPLDCQRRNAAEVFVLATPRGRKESQAARAAENEKKMEAARAKALALQAAREAELLQKREQQAAMLARRQARQRRDELLRRRCGWLLVCSLSAHTRWLGTRLEERRSTRELERMAARVQRRFRRNQFAARVSGLARARRMLRSVVWVVKLRVRLMRKAAAAKKVRGFLLEVRKLGAAIVAVRAFCYRVKSAQAAWRGHAQVTSAQVDLITMQCVRESERRLAEDAADEAASLDQAAGDADDADAGAVIVMAPAGSDLPIVLTHAAIRQAVDVTLVRRRKQRAAAIAEYRRDLKAYEELQHVNRTLLDAAKHDGQRVLGRRGSVVRATDGEEAARLLWHVVHVQRRVRDRQGWKQQKHAREAAYAMLVARHDQKQQDAVRAGLPPPRRVSFLSSGSLVPAEAPEGGAGAGGGGGGGGGGGRAAAAADATKSAPAKLRWVRSTASAATSTGGRGDLGSTIRRADLLKRASGVRKPDKLHLPVLLTREEVHETLEEAKRIMLARV